MIDLDLARAAAAISGIESGGNYGALGPVTKRGDRAYGKYQVMGANIPSWTQAALGRQLTADQFLNDRDAQEAVFKHRFGLLANQYGSPQDAASAWFTGRPISQSSGAARDVLGTSGNSYVEKFNKAYGGGSAINPADLPADASANAGPAVMPMAAAPQGVLSGVGGMNPILAQMPQEGFGDSLGRLSAAFMMRDSPQAASTILQDIRSRNQNAHNAIMRAEQIRARLAAAGKKGGEWKSGDVTFGTDGKPYLIQTNKDGEVRRVPAPVDVAPNKAQAEAIGRPAKQKAAEETRDMETGDFVTDLRTLQKLVADRGNAVAGPGAATLAHVPGSEAYRAKIMIDSLRDRIAFEKLRQMRSVSADGSSGLGQLTQSEFKSLTNTLGGIDLKMPPDKLFKVLEDVNRRLHRAVYGIKDGEKRYNALGSLSEFVNKRDADLEDRWQRAKGNNPATPAAAPAAPKSAGGAPKVGDVLDGHRFKGGDPWVRTNWEKVQ